MKKLLVVALTLSCFVILSLGQELLKNPGFEEPFTDDDWFAHGNCVIEQSTDAYEGQYSGYTHSRTQPWSGISQWIPMEPNSKYRFRAYFKILTLIPGYLWHSGLMRFQMEMSDGSQEGSQFALLPYSRPDWGWREIGGDFIMDGRDVVRARLMVQFQDDTDIEYLMDEATITKVVDDPDWKIKANQRIEQLRKDDVTINIESLGSCDPELVEVKLDHFHHDFPFGSATRAAMMWGETERDTKYQQTFYDNFNYATFHNSLKWKQMESIQGEIVYEISDNALDALEQHNIPVRGHTVLWGKQDNNPDWLHTGYDGEDMRDQLARRINYTVTHYKGRLEHWDVNNEQCHGDWYEQKVGDHNIMEWMFEEIDKLDPDTLLMLNDFAVIRGSTRTLCYTNSAKMLLEAGAPLDALGIQSHIKEYPDIALFQDRLDTVASAGLPIWITEMDYQDTDVDRRADGLEDALRLYFSQPQIDGIILWGFWEDEMREPHKSLFDGPDLTPNAAGLRWQHLLNTEWSTHETFFPDSEADVFSARAFYGNYTMTVNYDGDLKEESYFYVGKGQDNQLDIAVENC